MKTILFAMLAVTLSACSDNDNNNNNNRSANSNNANDSGKVTAENTNAPASTTASTDEAINAYLQLKNALTTDNGKEAATAGKKLHDAMQKLDQASFIDNQKKVYDEVKEDIKEHAEHISSNAEKIAHQREHFDMLSQDMYDLVKSVKPNQTLYKDHCPMYNDNKGAFWLSEVKEIKNPYLGKKMPTCGTITEEIK
jgi:hypothetical protein